TSHGASTLPLSSASRAIVRRVGSTRAWQTVGMASGPPVTLTCSRPCRASGGRFGGREKVNIPMLNCSSSRQLFGNGSPLESHVFRQSVAPDLHRHLTRDERESIAPHGRTYVVPGLIHERSRQFFDSIGHLGQRCHTGATAIRLNTLAHQRNHQTAV